MSHRRTSVIAVLTILGAVASAAASPPPSPGPPVRLSGRILNDGQPVANLPLRVQPVESPCAPALASPTIRTRTDAAGVFVVDVGRGQVVEVRAADDANLTVAATVAVVRSTDLGDLAAAKGRAPRAPATRAAAEVATVAITIRDDGSGQPVGGALVWEVEGVCWALADARGSARLRAARGSHLRVSAAGFRDGLARVGESGTLDIALIQAPASVSGIVRATGGTPIDRALVVTAQNRRAVRTGVDGTFLLSDLSPLPVAFLRVSAAGFSSTALQVSSRSTEELVVELHRPRDVRGRVLDSYGRAVTDATIDLELHGESLDPVATGPMGVFALRGVGVGRYAARVEAPDFATWTGTLDVPPGEGIADLGEIVLEPGRELYARVVDDAGQSLADVDVFLGSASRRLGWSGVPPGPPDFRSGADGRFLVTGLSPRDDRVLILRKAGFQPLAVPVPDAETDDPSFVMKRAGSLTIRVRNSLGEPVAGALVRGLRPPLTGSSFDLPTTDEHGELVVAAQPGVQQVVVEGRDGIWEGPVIVPAVGSEETVEVVLAEPWTLDGLISSSDGTPVAGAILRAEGLDTQTMSRADGTFRLDLLSGERVTVHATHPRYDDGAATFDRRGARSSGATIVLQDRSVFVEGRVEGPRVAGRSLAWKHIGTGRLTDFVTKDDGTFELGPVKPGQYVVLLRERGAEVVDPAHSVVTIDGLSSQAYLVISLRGGDAEDRE